MIMNLLKNKKGVSLIQIIVGLSLAILLGLGAQKMLVQVYKVRSNITAYRAIDGVKQKLTTFLQNRKSWRNIVCHPNNQSMPNTTDVNRTMNCFVGTIQGTPGFDCAGASGFLSIFDYEDNLYYEYSPNNGFDIDGTPCTDYAGDPKCFFRVNISWNIICDTASDPDACKNTKSPTLEITAKFETNKPNLILNTENYNVSFARQLVLNPKYCSFL